MNNKGQFQIFFLTKKRFFHPLRVTIVHLVFSKLCIRSYDSETQPFQFLIADSSKGVLRWAGQPKA